MYLRPNFGLKIISDLLGVTNTNLAFQFGNGVYNYYFNMNIPIKNRLQNIEEPLKSPRKMTPDLTYRPKFSKKYDLPQLSTYIRSFRKEIQLPINYQTSIFLSKTPQRCLNHNNVITLFCIEDKKPLCVHCMYQAFSHKKHEVVPINKASSTLKQQLKNTLQTITNSTLPKLSHYITKNESNLAKTEMQMNEHILLVTKFYKDLTFLINAKKNEHLRYCQQLSSKFKYQFSAFTNQLTKTLHFVQEKIQEITDRNSQQNLLFNHNTAFYLSKVDSILVPQIGEQPSLQTRQIQNRMEFVWRQLSDALNFDHKLVIAEERRRSLERVQSLPKYDKFTLWKSKSPQVNRNQGQNFYGKKPVNHRLSYKQMPKAPFTQREHFMDKNWVKKERKQKDKPSFITHQHIKKISEESIVKQQSTLNTNKMKSKIDDKPITAYKEV